MKLEFNKNDGYYFQPHCLKSLSGYNAPLFHQDHNLRPPFGIVSFTLSKVISTFKTFLDALEQYRITGQSKVDGNGRLLINYDEAKLLLVSYRNVIYTVAEYNEDLEDNLIKALVSKDADKSIKQIVSKFKKNVRPLRNHASKICNHLKHSQNTLNFSAMKSSAGTSEGYVVCCINNKGTNIPNPNIHKDMRAFSFNIDIRRMLSTVYLMGYEAGRFVDAMANNYSGNPQETMNTFIIKENPMLESVLLSISQLSKLGIPREDFYPVPIVRFDGQTLEIAAKGETHVRIHNAEMVYSFEGDGITTSFAVP